MFSDPLIWTSFCYRRCGITTHVRASVRRLHQGFITSQGFFSDMSISFATSSSGPGIGFSTVQVRYSTDGGGTFTLIGPDVVITGATQLISLAVPPRANNAPLLVLRLVFTGGELGTTEIDNIQVNGTIVPEPATVAGGLLGVLGLCWHQRRRLIRCVRSIAHHESHSGRRCQKHVDAR
jgi:PEP-CTERM motif